MLITFIRIVCFVVFFLTLLRVKKTRMRHLPSRRTRVSRHHGEMCVWLERFVSALLDMLHEALQDDANGLAEIRRPHAPPPHEGPDKWTMDDTTNHNTRRHRLVSVFEERVEAMLEDRGIASYASCRVHSIGHKPPIIRAIHVTNLTGTEAPAARGDSHGPASPAPVKGPKAKGGEDTASASAKGPKAKGGEDTASASSKGPKAKGGEDTGNGRLAEAVAYDEGITGSSPFASLPPSAVELEAEVEYAGGVDVSLRTDLCLPRGRLLPAKIRVSDVEYIKAHVRVRATLQYEHATMDSQRRPYLHCTLWLESEPMFSIKVRTILSRYGIRDFFLVPLIIKFFLLRFIRSRLMRPGGEGLTVRIPLPENIVDGGVQEWWSGSNDAATKAASMVNPESFCRNSI